jgi:hypothetical protein
MAAVNASATALPDGTASSLRLSQGPWRAVLGLW